MLCLFVILSVLFFFFFHSDKFVGIWENLPHFAQVNFAEIKTIVLKLLCFSLFDFKETIGDSLGLSKSFKPLREKMWLSLFHKFVQRNSCNVNQTMLMSWNEKVVLNWQECTCCCTCIIQRWCSLEIHSQNQATDLLCASLILIQVVVTRET